MIYKASSHAATATKENRGKTKPGNNRQNVPSPIALRRDITI